MIQMLVRDGYCEGCEWLKKKGTKKRGKVKHGFCPFVRCVKRKGFTAEYKRRGQQMNIAEKLIVNGNIGAQVKNDLGYVLFDYKANNPNKNITHARKLIEKALENDYGYNLDEIEIELSESINYIKLEVNEKVGIHER